jgi:hypothetical protein
MAEPGGMHISSTDKSVRELVEEVRRREEAARTQSRELARLREETLTTISQEATRMVATARSDIRAIIGKTRNGLTELVAQVEAIRGAHSGAAIDPPPPPGHGVTELESRSSTAPGSIDATLDRLSEARRSMHQILDEARPELERFQQEALITSNRDAANGELRHTNLRTPSAPTEAPHTEPARKESRWVAPTETAAMGTEPARAIRAWTAAPTAHRVLPAFEPPAPFQPNPSLQLRIGSSRRRGRQLAAAIGAIVGIGVAGLLATRMWMRQPGPAKASTPSAATIPAPSTVVAQPAATPPSTPAAAAPAVKPWSLRLDTRGAVWIQTTVDGRVEGGRLLQAGEHRTIEAKREVIIRAGNAGAVLVSIRGAEAKALGRDGEVATRRFVVGDAPAAATTPAQTSPATAGEKRAIDAARGDSARPLPDAGTAGARTGTTAPAKVEAETRATGRSAAPLQAGGPAGSELTTAAQRWLDGYYRRDAASMASIALKEVKVSDDRTDTERLPPGLNVRRTLDRVTTQFIGDTAILSGRVNDQADLDGRSEQSLSWISMVWMREAGVWRLMDARIISDSKLAGVKQ